MSLYEQVKNIQQDKEVELVIFYFCAANQAWAVGLAAESVVSSGAVVSAAGQRQTSDSAAAVAALGAGPSSGQRLSGGPGEGACDPEQAEAAPQGGQLRPGGLGEKNGGHGHTAGQKIHSDSKTGLK